MKPLNPTSSGVNHAVVAAFLFASVMLNCGMVMFILTAPELARLKASASGISGMGFSSENAVETLSALAAETESSSLPGSDSQCFDSQLQRAEASFRRNQERRSILTGSTEEQSIPFKPKAMASFLSVRSAAWKDVYLKEYMLFPRYPCLEEERVGMWGEGGKWVCLQSLHKKPEDITVYSIGSIGDTTFEEGMFTLLGVKSETFDPFLQPEQQQKLSQLPFLRFHNYGLSMDGSETVTERIAGRQGSSKDVHKMMKELGHTFVDVFKIDCEGCEVGFVDFLAKTTKRSKPVLGQILMEIHDANAQQVESKLMQQLANLGYRLYHLEPNFFALGGCWEVAFIHESLCQPGGVKLDQPLPSRRRLLQ